MLKMSLNLVFQEEILSLEELSDIDDEEFGGLEFGGEHEFGANVE